MSFNTYYDLGRDESPDQDLKCCPFCGAYLEDFGHSIRDDKKVKTFKHPDKESDWDRCLLSGLIFDKERWNKRPAESILIELCEYLAKQITTTFPFDKTMVKVLEKAIVTISRFYPEEHK